MTATLSPDHVAAALALRDLTDPAQGPHAVGLLLDAAVDALAARWPSAVRVLRSSPAARIRRHTSSPSRRGIITSRTIASGRCASTESRAAWPSLASSTW